MFPTTKKTIAVVGATGLQGSSVARTFASLPNWHVRGLTRNSESSKSQSLAGLGVEMVKADLADPASLARALDGVHAIFLNTDFWETYQTSLAAGVDHGTTCKQAFETEVAHGRNVANVAARIPTLERLVYSALGPMRKASVGKYCKSMHWETKASIVEYIETERPQLAAKTSYIYCGAYSTNKLLYPERDPATGAYAIVLPARKTARFPILNPASSTGSFVRALIEDEEAGAKLLAYDSYLTIQEALDVWKGVTGKEASVVEVTLQDMHERTGIPYEILDGPAFISEFGYMAGVDGVIEPGQLRNKVETVGFEEWMKGRDVDELLRGVVFDLSWL